MGGRATRPLITFQFKSTDWQGINFRSHGRGLSLCNRLDTMGDRHTTTDTAKDVVHATDERVELIYEAGFYPEEPRPAERGSPQKRSESAQQCYTDVSQDNSQESEERKIHISVETLKLT